LAQIILGEIWIKVCSNEGQHPFPWANDIKGVKNTMKFKQISFPEPAGQLQSNLVQIILG
jgi:hypothetical protein